MASSEKSGSPTIRRLLFFFLFGALFVGFLILFLLYYARHPSFPRLVERIVNARLENRVAIGGVSLSTGRLIVTDLSIAETAGENPILVVPRAEITYRPRELLNRTVDTITVIKPKLVLTTGGKPSKERSPAPAGLPFTFRRALIREGELTIRMTHGAVTALFNSTMGSSTVAGGPVFQWRSDFGKVSVAGEERLNVLEGASGELDASLALSDNAHSGELQAEAHLTTPRWNVTEPHRLSLKAGYDDRTGRLTLEHGRFASPLLGALDLQGSVENFPSDHAAYNIRGTGTNIALGPIHRLILAPLDLGTAAREVNGSGTGSLQIKGSNDSAIDWDATLLVEDLSIALESGRLNLTETPLHLSSRGNYAPRTDTVHLNPWTVKVGERGAGTLTGTVTGISSGDPRLELHFQGKEISVTPLAAGLAELTKAWPDWLEIEGLGNADAQILGSLHSPRIGAFVDLQGRRLNLAGVQLTPFQARLPINYEKGTFRLDDAALSGNRVVVPLDNSKQMRLTLSRATLQVPKAVIDGGDVTSRGMSLNAASAALGKVKGPQHKEEALVLKGNLSNNPNKGRLALNNMSFQTRGLTGLAGNLYFDWKDDSTVGGDIHGARLDLKTLGQSYGHYLPQLSQLQLSGNGSFASRFTAALAGNSPRMEGTVEMTVTDGAFSSPDGTRAAEGAAISVTSRFNLLPARDEITLDLDGLATGFELLWGRFYGSFAGKSIHFSLGGRYDGREDALVLSHGRIGMADLGRISLTGKIHEVNQTPAFESQVRLEDFSSRAAYDLFVRETFQESLPLLSDLQVDGSLTAALTLNGTADRFQVDGRIGANGMNVTSRELDLAIRGLTLDLPVQVLYPRRQERSRPRAFGSLGLEKFSLHGVAVDDLHLSPAVWQNSLVIRDDISVPLLGGRLIAKEILYENLPYDDRKLTLSIIPEQLDLAQVSDALGMPRFNGVLSGVIPKVRFQGRQLTTEGEIRLSLFGGEMRISEISVDNVFSPAAALKSSIAISSIDLNQLTDTFEFGHISGILQGYVNDLEVVNGQPARFDALLETVKTKGVEQRMSVQALEKITILGSGATPSLFGRGIYRLFKEYRYAKMGFKSRLRNDHFQVRGIEVIGDREYLVVGSLLPPKVNVINYTQNISFREMVSRLKRIETAGQAEKGR